MTPATQREIWGTDTLLRPRVYEVTDEAVTWSEVEPVAPTLELDTLLDDFCDLANARPGGDGGLHRSLRRAGAVRL